MSIYQVSKNTSTSRCKDLVLRVSTLREAIVMLCSSCIASSAYYVFSSLSLKCLECIYRSIACDRNAFAKGFNKIKSKKKKLEMA
jgi:hypothetical protein